MSSYVHILPIDVLGEWWLWWWLDFFLSLEFQELILCPDSRTRGTCLEATVVVQEDSGLGGYRGGRDRCFTLGIIRRISQQNLLTVLWGKGEKEWSQEWPGLRHDTYSAPYQRPRGKLGGENEGSSFGHMCEMPVVIQDKVLWLSVLVQCSGENHPGVFSMWTGMCVCVYVYKYAHVCESLDI
jgi:hypothetical protein